MKQSVLAIHGAVAGIIAGAIVAAWFFALDVAAGSPLLTPAVLGSLVFGQEFSGMGAGAVAAYSLLHFGVFAALGAAAAVFLGWVGAAPGIMVGLVFGLGVLNVFHYGALLMGGVIASLTLPYAHVMSANLLGGAGYAAYLHRARRSPRPLGPAILLEPPLLRRGLKVGALGAVAVAAWFFLLDLITGRPFFTPAALGSAVLLGVDGVNQVRVTAGIVAAYSMLHLAAFAAIGVLCVWTAERVTTVPGRWLVVAMSLVVLEGLFIGTAGTLLSWVMDELAWWAVLVGNLAAVGAMWRAIWTMYPELHRRLLREPVATAV